MSLQPLFLGDVAPGRYRFAGPLRLSELRRQAHAAGWACPLVDGGVMHDRASMFDEFASALAFPQWFGRNWDAFADCLRDLSWLPASGYVVLWRRSSAFRNVDRETYDRCGSIIDESIAARVEMRLPPLYVLYAGPRSGPSGVAASRLRSVR